jgi:hypothetical protein
VGEPIRAAGSLSLPCRRKHYYSINLAKYLHKQLVNLQRWKSRPPGISLENSVISKNFPGAFLDLFNKKIVLSLGIIQEAARVEIDQIVTAAVARVAEASREGLSQVQLDLIAINAIKLQNLIVAVSTDHAGNVNVSKGVKEIVSRSICPLYPFC